jgi:hypothetical protein
MQSKANTVAEYLAELPDDRRATLEALRAVIRKNLDPLIEEGMQYGHIGYYIPHKVFPAGYHCDPKQPLPYAALGAQKNHLGLYLMCLYVDAASAGRDDLLAWFREAWRMTGKKLDMGAACVRFKKIDDVPLDVVAALFKKVTAKKYLAAYEAVGARGRAPPGRPAVMEPRVKKAAAAGKARRKA